jgi:hypothetical protein
MTVRAPACQLSTEFVDKAVEKSSARLLSYFEVQDKTSSVS